MELILVILVIAGVFAFIMKRVFSAGMSIKSEKEYLYARSEETGKRGLNKLTVVLTTIASNFQAANVFAVGLYLGYTFGAIIGILSGTFAAGVLVLYWLLKTQNDEDLRAILENYELPYERLFRTTNKKTMGVVYFVIYTSVLFSAVLEIWYGTIAVEAIVEPMAPAGSAGILFPVIAALLSILLFIYVYVGGYIAVAITDKIQMVIIGLLIAILLAGCLVDWSQSIGFETAKFFLGSSGKVDDPWFLVAIFVGATTINLCWQIVSPQQWQRANAAEDRHVYMSSLPASSLGVLITWLVPVTVGAFLAGTIGPQGYHDGPYSALTTWYYTFAGSNGAAGVASLWVAILLGVAIAGVFAAALSTADTAIIAVVAKIVTMLPENARTLDAARNKASIATFIVAILAVAVFYANPRIEQMIILVSTPMMIFAPFFIRYILSGGRLRIFRQGAGVVVTYSFLAALIAAVIFNLAAKHLPYGPSLGFWFSFALFLVGVIASRIAMSETSDRETNHG